MNPLSLLFLVPRALVKIKRSFLLKLTVWLQEHTANLELLGKGEFYSLSEFFGLSWGKLGHTAALAETRSLFRKGSRVQGPALSQREDESSLSSLLLRGPGG